MPTETTKAPEFVQAPAQAASDAQPVAKNDPAPAPKPVNEDPHKGIGGDYVIGEDGIRRTEADHKKYKAAKSK